MKHQVLVQKMSLTYVAHFKSFKAWLTKPYIKKKI